MTKTSTAHGASGLAFRRRASALRPILAALLCAAFLALPAAAAHAQGSGSQATPGLVDQRRRAAYAEFAALLAPDPAFAAIGAQGEPLSLANLARAGFLASGLAAEKVAAYEARLFRFLDELAAAVDGPRGPGSGSGTAKAGAAAILDARRAEAALAFLHERLFKRYELDATTLDLAMDTGRYNCVSSALVYLLALKRLGIPAAGVRTVDHAFCLVRLPERDIDVETTNPHGFDPGTKKEFADGFGRVTGYSYVPPGDYSRRTTIDERELAALVLSNRASVLDRTGRYREALALGTAYDALAGGKEGRNFLLDRVNNLAVELERRRDRDGAEDLVEAARAALGSEPRLEELRAVVAYNRAVSLAEAGRWEEALAAAERLTTSGAGAKDAAGVADAALAALAQRLVDARDYAGARALVEAKKSLGSAKAGAQLLGQIAEAELADAAKTLPFREALAAADRALASGAIPQRRWEEFLAFIYGNEANRIARSGDWLAAAALASEGAGRAPGSGGLARAAAGFRQNYVAAAHNRFAALYNKGDYAGAKAAIEAALAELPKDATLLSDLALAEKALKK
ncbi:MAG: hypothetical protein JNG85_06485 [Spirochaetaceae bacterium]|nr:hypothetical protein [Spirochaetaceae bacterium]